MKKKVIKNTIFLSMANFFARLIGFFYFVFLGRILGVENFGHYNFALALVYNFYPVADFGVERLILRDLSKDTTKAQKYFQKIIPLRFILALISIFLVTLLGYFLSKTSFDRINVFVFSLCLVPWTFNQLVAGIGNAFEKMEIQSLVIVGMSLLTAVFGGLTAFFGGGVTLILLAAFLANLVVSFLMFFLKGHLYLQFLIDFDSSFWKKILKESWIFASIMIIAVFYLRASVILVNYFKGPYYTGLYSSVFKFIEASLLIPQSFALALFPQAARLIDSDKKRLGQNYLKSLGIIFVFSLIYALVFWFFAPLIIKISYGSSYLPAVMTMKILGIGAILFFLNALPGNIIQNSQKVKYYPIFSFLNFLFLVILGAVLIPKNSIVGAAWAVLLAEALGFLINNAFVWKIIHE